jgi:superfamily II DNA or RNA helicase
MEDGTYRIVQLPHQAGKCTHIVKMLAKHHGRNKMLVNFSVAAYNKGRHILIQSDLLDHLDTLAALLGANGIPATDIGFYVGGLTKAQRDHIKATKRVILASYTMTAEATDIPRLDTLIMASPKSDIRQIAGRILRSAPNKNEPIIFDPIDTSSSVFSGYWGKRADWYRSIGAEVDLGT